jgi:hypothetical protein
MCRCRWVRVRVGLWTIEGLQTSDAIRKGDGRGCEERRRELQLHTLVEEVGGG